MNGFTNNFSNLPPGVSEFDEHINPSDDMPDICDDDYVLSDCGPLGGKTYVNQLDQEFSNFDDAIIAIRRHMDSQQFWPNVWYVNDHGNTDLLAVSQDGTNGYHYDVVKSWV